MVEIKYTKGFKSFIGLDEDTLDFEVQKLEEELIEELGEAIAVELDLR